MRRAPLLALLLAAATAAPPSASAQVDPPGVDRSLSTADAIASLRQAAGSEARLVERDGALRIASRLSLHVRGSTPGARALELVRRFGPAFGAGEGVDLRIERVNAVAGMTVVRLRRHALDRPVLLRSVLVRSRADGAIDLVFAATGPSRVDDAPYLVSSDAIAADALHRIPRWPSARVASVSEVGLPLGDAIVRGYVAEVEGGGATERALLVYDRAGELIVAAPRAPHALGRVYDPNPVVAMELTSDLELEHLTSRERLTGRYVRVSSCGTDGSTCTPRQTAVADAAGDFLFDPIEPVFDDPFAEVSAYFHADRAAAYFREQHDFTWTCCEGTSVMEIVVNYSESPGTPYDNAAYAPSQCSRDECGTIVLGQGSARDFSYDGDVVYHEYTHSIVDETAGIVGFDLDNLGISYEPLGINEGTADYFAASIAGDPRIGEYFAGLGAIGTPGSLRELDGGTRCPESLVGEGHLDGRVWSGTLWAIREALGAGKADAIAFLTLSSMTDNTVFADAAELAIASAEALEAAGTLETADVAVVREAVGTLGLEGCRRIVPLDDLETHTGYSGVEFATGSLGGSVVPLHYSLEIPADATEVRLHLRRLTLAGRYTYYFRNDEALRFVASRRPPLINDASVPGDALVTIDAASAHPLAPCSTLYIGLTVDDLSDGESLYEIRAELDRSGDPDAECAPPEPDAGPAIPGADAGGGADAAPRPAAARSIGGGGGCDCTSSGDGPRGGGLAALALALWIWRRRRAGLR